MTKLFRLEDDISLVSGLTFALEKAGLRTDGGCILAEADTLWAAGPFPCDGKPAVLKIGQTENDLENRGLARAVFSN